MKKIHIAALLVAVFVYAGSLRSFGQNIPTYEELSAKYSEVTDVQLKEWQDKADSLFASGKFLEAYNLYNDVLMANQILHGTLRSDMMYKSALSMEKAGKYVEAESLYKAVQLIEPSEEVSAAIERIGTASTQEEGSSVMAMEPSNTAGSPINSKIVDRATNKLKSKYSDITREQIQTWEKKADDFFEKGKYARAVQLYSDVYNAEMFSFGKMRSDIFEKQQSAYDLFMNELNQKNAVQDARAAAAADILNSLGNTLLDAAETIPDKQDNTALVNGAGGSSDNGKKIDDNAGHSASEVQAMQSDRRTYSSWESQLIKMNTYYERDYNDAQRRNIQQQMKSIREKWEGNGFEMYHSTWEDWDGVKK